MNAWWNAAWQAPVLPSVALGPLWVALSWGLLGAALLWMGAARQRRAWLWRAWGVVLLMSLCWPATRSWTAWLALALQSPSLLGLVWLLHRAWRVTRRPAAPATPLPLAWALAGVVLGWALWLDTLNLWPAAFDVPLFAWGFSAAAFWLVLAAVAGAAWRAARLGTSAPWVSLLLVVLALFALTRWPSGNVWDALLDPAVWLACHWVCVRAWLARRGGQAPRR